MKKIILPALFCLLISACRRETVVVQEKDYKVYLDAKLFQDNLDQANAEISFWQSKLQDDPGSFVMMMELGHRMAQRFRLTGQVLDVHIADSLFYESSKKLNHTESSIYFARSQNAITQHRFKDAYQLTGESENQDASPFIANLLKFDAALELGLVKESGDYLDKLENKKSFDYLIRKAKLEDQDGNLEQAIYLVEEALSIYGKKNKAAYTWLMSNLGDMYGHSGRIKDSYKAYLDVLKVDSSNMHCLKGMAWIAFAHDKNIPAAKKIIEHILSVTSMPELYLFLAEMEEYAGNMGNAAAYTRKFKEDVTRPGYGAMYNSYLANEYVKDPQMINRAHAIANSEIDNRPTPGSYALLAWVLYHKGETRPALDIIRAYVAGKDYEPETLVKMAYIYAANNLNAKAAELLQESLKSSFELGPVKTQELEKKLSELNAN